MSMSQCCLTHRAAGRRGVYHFEAWWSFQPQPSWTCRCATRMRAPGGLPSLVAQILDRSFEHFVASGSNAGDGRSHDDVRLHADALELSAIGKAHFLTGETYDQIAGQDHIGDVAVGAVGR